MQTFTPSSMVFSIPFYAGTKSALLAELREELGKKDGRFLIMFTPNPEQLMLAQKDREFEALLKKSVVNLPDGIGIVFAARVLGLPKIAERIAGREVMVDLLEIANELGLRIFLLGGWEDTAQKLSAIVRRGYDNIKSIDYDQGALNAAHPTPEEEKRIKEHITHSKPDMVFVSYGAPEQEKWVIKHAAFLKAQGVKLVMVVGGAFDVLTGTVSTPPKFAVRLHLEWLWRLLQEPWRWKRQIALLRFIAKVLRTSASGLPK